MGFFSKKHSIGKTIAELRKEKGWTQIELAEKLQVSDKAISKWEKDSGAPSIEFFPMLAEVFGVSIDYLMTGKKVEPEIITMSKIELCAKNDDVSLVKDINLTTTDENGKTLIDYIIQYKSYKVFAEICEKIDSKKFGVDRYIEFSLITNKTKAIEGIKENYAHIEDKSYFEKKEGVKPLCLITDKLLDIIVLDKRVNNDTIDYLLSNQKDRQCVWFLVLPYLLHQSYLHNNMELFNKILNVSIVSNQHAYEHFKIPEQDSYARNYYHFGYFLVLYNIETGVYIDSLSKKHGLVRGLEKTIKLALERSDIETVEKLNNLNTAVMKYYSQFKCYIATADEIRIAKLKMDKSISESEIKIQSTIHEGVVCVKELVELKDFKTIKKVILENPIHELEVINSLIENSDLRTLFRYSVDKKLSWHIDKIVTGNTAKLGDGFVDVLWKDFGPNQHEFYYRENGREKEIFSRVQRGYSGYTQPKTLKEALELINRCRQRIIDDLSLKYDKEKTVGELTKEYFENELAKGNTDMVVIKLCVRLEAILRCDYHYEGDFVDMLNKYCGQFNTYDDEGNDYDPYTPKMLNKLRMQRNGIVHSEKYNESLTIDELKWCIDYICKM